ncbi:unnamed protein product [Mytilus edulis]|uniref:Reverse transcriptase/retrotransposon-derived protein RNase H-like domain-containing protein n=1 Tax=Mytilus edulis TaxID=6550 RepID=A0A8S3UXZ2_MYTED|nr:unnamed protein product [Mytilus edulis]
MAILKELWTNEIDDPEVKSTYQYVIDLRERLEATCELARSNLASASKKNKVYYDKSTKQRHMKVGDKVLVLLPTDKNKLLMQWKGPFTITEKFGKVDYRIQMNGKIKTFHANLLKRYVERCDVDDLTVVSSAVIDTDSDQVDVYDEIHEIPFTDSGENASHIDVIPDLDENQLLQVKELLFSFPEVFTDSPGCTDLLGHDIKLSSETPVRTKPYPIPYSMLDTVNAEVSKMLDLGVIEASTSPYASPIVIVKKKDNTNRFCIDFRSLNSQTLFDAEPMGNAEEMFSKLAGHKYFSRIDLSKGYWQLPLSEDAKPKTAFQTPKGSVFPNFSCIALPLTDLTKKGQPSTVVWENAQENAFQSLRCALVRFPILKLPDFTKIFVLMTDASDRGIGAVLMQYQENSKMPIAYASRKLKKSEVAYSTIEKECLAIVWAVQKFQRYLYGREFILETDHQPLTYLNKKKVENARLMR